jgi:hypothetical protein
MSTLITCGYLNTIQKMADDVWTDPMKNNDLIADVITANAVLSNQAIKLEELKDKNKRKEVRVGWLTKCNVETQECTGDCDISGEDADPVCEDYDIECLQETSFKLGLRGYRDRDIEFQEALAFNKLVAFRALDEWLAQYILTGIITCAGSNLFTGGIGAPGGNPTFIPPQYWDDNIWAYLSQVVRLNKFRNPYFITGNLLYPLLFNRPLEAGTAGDFGGYKKMQTMRVYQDPENVEVIAPGQAFLLHKTAVAFINKAWNPLNAANAVNRAGQYWEWSEASYNIPGIYYDLTMKETCEGDEFYQAIKVKLHGLFACNPYPCDETNTGTLIFECGTGE